MTNQEMFDKAYLGLKSQGFAQCLVESGNTCAYSIGNKHCAWGWVDPYIPPEYNVATSVISLYDMKIGEAGKLTSGQVNFVHGLQQCHDTAKSPASMETNLRLLAQMYSLNVP